MRRTNEANNAYARQYYEQHKEEIAAKNRIKYQEKKKQGFVASPAPTDVFNKSISDLLKTDCEFEEVRSKIVEFYPQNTSIEDMVKGLAKMNVQNLFIKAACTCEAAEWEPILKQNMISVE